MKLRYAILALVAGELLGISTAFAVGSGSVGPIIAFGEQRRQIEATPILERPYRPLHFYGNTVRRRYYRNGGGMPTATAAAPAAAVSQPQK
jgi:hypothetical protein